MLRQPRSVPFILFLLFIAALPVWAQAPDAGAELEVFLRIAAVAGREEPAREFVRQRLQGLPVEQDGAGNLVLTLGSGSPRRLVLCPLGEPGFVVTRIEPEGWLRISPVSGLPVGALWAQAHEGNVVTVGGAKGLVAGGGVLRSVHLMQETPDQPDPLPFGTWNAWIDVGAESAAEVEALGVRLLDPVALLRRPVRLAGDRVAGPSARIKGACVATVDAARALAQTPPAGTVVFAWTSGDLLNGAGLVHLLRQRGPFEQALRMSRWFGWTQDEKTRGAKASDLPADGSGLLTAGATLAGSGYLKSLPLVAVPEDSAGTPAWGTARITDLGLPARYPETPVETVAVAEVGKLADLLLTVLGRPGARRPAAPPLPSPPVIVETTEGHAQSAPLLAALISRYGVSGAEGPVREEILRRLPAWAKPEVDVKGNVTVTIGRGKEHILFVSHMDEVGFRVAEVLPDGKLRLEDRGGVLRTAWEGQAALVHGDRGSVPAVFAPRADWRSAERADVPDPFLADLGVASAAEATALGVHQGSTVTMPKRMFRMGAHRALARGFDDRNGCTALLLALSRIDPAKLTRRVTFAWDVEEEVGVIGAGELARRLTDLTEVHPVDTFVSSDTPRESHRFAYAPLGRGPVLRAMDNATIVPRDLVERFRALAARAGIPVQVGFTGGATDGVPFLAAGVPMLPFSWPGRSSHSPVEVADLRDVDDLVRLILATIDAPAGI
jgi:putative aminopeptidase FrvX